MKPASSTKKPLAERKALEKYALDSISKKITASTVAKCHEAMFADGVIAGELEGFFSRHPKCEAFAEIFEYLRSLEIGEDTAATVANPLLAAESKKGTGQFQTKYTDEEFLAIFPDKAGASATGLEREATDTIGMSKASFYLFLPRWKKSQ